MQIKDSTKDLIVAILIALYGSILFIWGYQRACDEKDSYYKPILIENDLAEYKSDDKGRAVFLIKENNK